MILPPLSPNEVVTILGWEGIEGMGSIVCDPGESLSYNQFLSVTSPLLSPKWSPIVCDPDESMGHESIYDVLFEFIRCD